MSRLSLAARQRLAALVVFDRWWCSRCWRSHWWQALRYPDRPGPASGPGVTRIVIIKGMSLSEIAAARRQRTTSSITQVVSLLRE